jgi:hypothetical protein
MKKFLIYYGYFMLGAILLAVLAGLGAQSLLFIGFALGWFVNEHFTVKKKPKRKPKAKKI